MKVEIIAIGSELVNGRRLDTNSQWLSRRLGELGLPVHFHTTLGDQLDEDVEAFRFAADRADLVLTTGGLGPTQDDLTRNVLALVSGAPLVEDAESLRAISAMFARRNRVMAERNRVQALFPEGAEPLPNPVGSAAGIWTTIGRATFVSLPGVPSEMKVMFEGQVVPRMRERGWVGRVIVHHTINLFGRGESEIEKDAMDLTVRGRLPEVGITAHDATISFQVSAEGADEADARRRIAPTLEIIRSRFAPLIVGEGTEDVAEGLVRELARTGATLATAESCTGGLVAQRITEVPGVSPYFLGGVVSYANAAKVELLGVPAGLIASKGAVSPEAAEAMAEGVRKRLAANVGLAVTGIAGPTGGTESKPVGLVFLGLASSEGTRSLRLDIGPEQPRDVIRSRAAKHAMNWARVLLSNREDRRAPTVDDTDQRKIL